MANNNFLGFNQNEPNKKEKPIHPFLLKGDLKITDTGKVTKTDEPKQEKIESIEDRRKKTIVNTGMEESTIPIAKSTKLDNVFISDVKKNKGLTFTDYPNKKTPTKIETSTTEGLISNVNDVILAPSDEVNKKAPVPPEDLPSLTFIDKIREWRQDPVESIPFLSGIADAEKFGRLLIAAKKLNDETADESDIKLLQDYLDYSKRNRSFGYNVADIILDVPAFAGELYLTAGAASVTKKATIEASEKMLKKLLKEGGEELLQKRATKLGLKLAGGIVGRTVQTPIAGVGRITAGALEKQLQSELGKFQGEEGEDLFTSLKKSFGEQWVETLSEFSGGVLTELSKPIKNKFIKTALFAAFKKANKGKPVNSLVKIVNRTGWNGVLGEMFEERVADVGNALLSEVGLSDQQFNYPTARQLGEELVAFSVPGVAVASINKWDPTLNKIKSKLEKISVGLTIEDVSKKINELESKEELNTSEQQELNELKSTQSLVEEAQKYDTAEEFVEANDLGTAGLKFHVTDNPNFKIDKNIIPSDLPVGAETKKVLSKPEFEKRLIDDVNIFRDRGIKSETEISQYIKTQRKIYEETGGGGGLMVTRGLESWLEEGVLSGDRKYVAIIDTGNVPLKDMTRSTRGFGDEIFVANPQNAKVVKVVPIEEALKIQKQQQNLTKSQLTDIWNKAQQETEKTQELLETPQIAGEGFVTQPADARVVSPEVRQKQEIRKRSVEQIVKGEKKLDKVRNDLREWARGVREGNIETKKQIKNVQNGLISLIENSRLEANDKAKFIKTIKNIQTKKQLQKSLSSIEQRILRLESSQRFRDAKNKIKKSIKSTKIKNRVSKFPAELQNSMQNMFNRFREHLKLNQEQAQDKLQNLIKDLDGKIPTLEQRLEIKLLSIKSGSNQITETEAEQLAEDLNDLIEEGKKLKDLKEFESWQETENNIEDILESLKRPEGIETFGAKKKTLLENIKNRLKILGVKALSDWRGLMMDLDWSRSIQDKVLEDSLGNVTPQNSKYADLYGKYDRKLNKNIRESYPERFDKKFSKLPDKVRNSLEFNHWTEGFVSRLIITDLINEKVNLGKLKNKDNVSRELNMTRGELIKRWVELQDPTLKESFIYGNRYTKEIIEAINNNMTEQDKTFASKAMEMWQELYDQINPVYKSVYGINLPKNPFYSPIRREGFEVDIENQFGEFLGEQYHRSAVTSGSFNERKNSILPIKRQDVFQSLDKHFGEMTYFIAWAERVRQFHQIFNDKRVRDSVVETFGDNAGGKLLERIDFQIRQFANKGHRNSTSFEKMVGKLRRGFIMGKIFFKPAIMVKQLVSRINALEVLTVKEQVGGEREFWAKPKKTSKILRDESPILRERGRFYERDINDVLKSDEYARFSKIKSFLNLGGLYVQIGDADATSFPIAWAYRKKLMKDRGLDPNDSAPEEVIAIYEDFIDNTQQSSNTSTQSEWQQSGDLAKLFTTFRTQQHQNARKVVNSVKSVFQEGGTSKENLKKVARTIVIYHSIQNMLFQLISTGLIQLIGDDDEEFVKDMARAGILGSLNFFPMGYDLIDSVIRAVMGSQVFNQGAQDTPISAISKDIYNLTREIDPTEIDDFEVMEFIDDLARIGGDFGVPSEQALNLGRGVYSMTKGNFLRGTLEMSQWSQWALSPLDEGNGSGVSPASRENKNNIRQKPQRPTRPSRPTRPKR